jgi:hypothetical protein
MNLSDLLADKPVEAALSAYFGADDWLEMKQAAFVKALCWQDLWGKEMREALRAAWEKAAELAQEREPAADGMREALEKARVYLAAMSRTGHAPGATILVKAIDAALSRAGNGWQPIETAPKDGTTIIVSGGIAHWHEGAWKTLTGYEYPGRLIQWKVTQWMPLPAPPEGGSPSAVEDP